MPEHPPRAPLSRLIFSHPIFSSWQDKWWLTELLALFAMWGAADLAYFQVLPLFGVRPNYNDSPIAITLFYLFWTGATIITFWPIYARWQSFSHWPAFQRRLTDLAIWCVGFAAMVSFTTIVLPALPSMQWSRAWGPEPELPLATSLYFLPKSVEILFQQLLALAVVLLLAADGIALRRICVFSALIFGGAHALLFFDAVPLGYVIRFAVSATLFGAVFPYFILRVRNGLAFTYAIHWSYYAVTILMAREFGPAGIMTFFKSLLGA